MCKGEEGRDGMTGRGSEGERRGEGERDRDRETEGVICFSRIPLT